MGVKEDCKELMSRFFGPATANMVDQWDESIVVEKCRKRVRAFLGEDAAKEFDNLLKEAQQ